MPRETLLRLSMLEAAPCGDEIFADIRNMLVALGRRSGIELLFEGTAGSASSELHARIDSELPQTLMRELGIHRVQFVPDTSTSGRIETMRVLVELVIPASPTEPSTSAAILKTYNYPLGWVVCHSTGEKLALLDVLSGGTS